MTLKHIACTLGLVLGPSALAAQDSTAAPEAAAPAAAPSLTVMEAVIARSVMDRVAQDTGSAFPAAVGQVVCWTKISGATAGTIVHHVWFFGDTQVGDVELTLGGSPWRTWSRKTVPAEATGAWHVEIRDASGAVLRRVDFTVGG
jgi:hypothetical protein